MGRQGVVVVVQAGVAICVCALPTKPFASFNYGGVSVLSIKVTGVSI